MVLDECKYIIISCCVFYLDLSVIYRYVWFINIIEFLVVLLVFYNMWKVDVCNYFLMFFLFLIIGVFVFYFEFVWYLKNVKMRVF